ncbi:mannosyltransferase [Armillaria solidipes]|uniref:Alpha-1,3/1,6-mannosyltransferase ALG2 n=1 Tax=Armillaria solidipes TaxID=1076256 RepID=A0A2H3B4D7_9AGAR|nr:mannosyltransferase [Armillaria solidipes]
MRVAFLHPDLGIGGAERLVVDAALGLQGLGHSVDIYTSHHDPNHCFEETKDGSLSVFNVKPPVPRALKGKFHILFAHARQLHLTAHILFSSSQKYDVFFVDQLSTCIPYLRMLGKTRVVFYCHFPDKLLANGAFIEGSAMRKQGSLLKRIYRFPMDWWEEITTRQADIILANSSFTARVFKSYFPSISATPRVVYPGINITAYEAEVDTSDPDVVAIASDRPSFISLNRFEKKKNAALAIESFAQALPSLAPRTRLVIAGGYDPRLEDNMLTLYSLIDLAKRHALRYNVVTPSTPNAVKIPPLNTTRDNPDVLFLLNFTTAQRSWLLKSLSTKALLYTPTNEHFGIVPVEAMICGLPVLACDSGGPVESVVDGPADQRTGWLRAPQADLWAEVLKEIDSLGEADRNAISKRAKERARRVFSMDAMALSIEEALKKAISMGESGISRGWELFGVMLIGFLFAYLLGPWLI